MPLADDPHAALRNSALRSVFDGAESVYDRPFQWGSKRTGPDLARIGGKYSDEWHRLHLLAPRDLVPESNMPDYPWLGSASSTVGHRRHACACCAARRPVHRRDIDGCTDAVEGKTELDALVAYLQGLGAPPESHGAEDGAMNPRGDTIAGVITLVLMLVFIGIWIWAWRPHHRAQVRRAGAPSDDRRRRAAAGDEAPR